MVSNALSSWQIGLCWFASILKALLKVESRRRMVLVLPLQRAASNNDTLPSLSLLSGVPLTKTMMTRVILVLVTMRIMLKSEGVQAEKTLHVEKLHSILPDFSIMLTPLDNWLCGSFDPIDSSHNWAKTAAKSMSKVTPYQPSGLKLKLWHQSQNKLASSIAFSDI